MKNSFFRRCPSFLIAVLFLLAPLSGTSAQEEEFPQENVWTQATPSVVWCNDPSSTTTLEVHIVGRTDVARVWMTNLGAQADEAQGELFDDGTHGDAQPGDRVFTLADVVLPCNPEYLATRGGQSNWWGFLRVEIQNGTRIGNNYGMIVGLVDPAFKNTFQVENFGNGLSATSYAFFIEDTDHTVMDSYPVTSVYCGTQNYNAYRKLYSVLPDNFDFALVMPGMQIFRPSDLAENVPYDVTVANNVQNIGMDIFDHTADFGSAGRLRAAIFHSFGDIAIVDHEMGHAWGVNIGQTLNLMDSWNGSPMLGHWNANADIQGQMGAYFFDENGNVGHFADNGDGTWHLVANTEVEAYSPLEMYLMGMIPPEEVPPVHILQNPNMTDTNRITADSYTTVTINQIMQAEGGARIPSAAEAQKDFNMAFIVTQDKPFNDAAYAYFSLLSHRLTSKDPPQEHTSFAPFYWATGGRGTLDTRLPVSLPDPFDLPTPTLEILPPVQADLTATPTTTAPASSEPGPNNPLCAGTMIAGGLILLPGLWLLLRKRSGL